MRGKGVAKRVRADVLLKGSPTDPSGYHEPRSAIREAPAARIEKQRRSPLPLGTSRFEVGMDSLECGLTDGNHALSSSLAENPNHAAPEINIFGIQLAEL